MQVTALMLTMLGLAFFYFRPIAKTRPGIRPYAWWKWMAAVFLVGLVIALLEWLFPALL